MWESVKWAVSSKMTYIFNWPVQISIFFLENTDFNRKNTLDLNFTFEC